MTKNIISCNLNNSVTELMEIISSHKIRHIPIIEEKKLLGIVSIGDVVNHIIEQYKDENKQLRDFINQWKKIIIPRLIAVKFCIKFSIILVTTYIVFF